MTKTSIHHSVTDSELGSVGSDRTGRIGAILCPAFCALLLVGVFAVSFVAAKLAFERYDAFCTSRNFDVAKLYIFPNLTIAADLVPTP